MMTLSGATIVIFADDDPACRCHTGVLDATRQTGVLSRVKLILDGQQCRFCTCARFNDLTRCRHVAIVQRVVVAELPAVEAALFAQFVDQTFQTKRGD